MKTLPPIEKVYEAWTAIADGRVHFSPENENQATVVSSGEGDSSKSYTIVYDPEKNTYASDDNSTFWRGYPGYPVLAVMMLQGKLPLDKSQCALWKDINWNTLNAAHKRDYAAAVAQVEAERGIDPTAASASAQKVMDALQASGISTKRYYRPKK